jgi:hypothetical protein
MDTTKIKKYIDALPPAVRTAVLAKDWRDRIGEIGQKYSLHIDQISSLEYETLFVMIGMEPEQDFASNIEKEVNVSKILAEQLAEEINDRVFKAILKSIEEKSVPKAPRFVEKEVTKETPLVKPTFVPQQPIVKPIQPAPVQAPKPVPRPVMRMDEKGALLTDLEKMSDAPAPMARVVAPPINLPTDEKGDMQAWADAPREVVQPAKPTPVPKIKKEIPIIKPVPQPMVPVTPMSLADAKLNSTVAVESETTKISHVDPYREPID